MAFGRLERNPVSQPMSDINMTPLIDVMLVLLVIFMLSAPFMVQGLAVDLPKTGQTQGLPAGTNIAVSVDSAGQAYLDQQPVSDVELAAALGVRAQANQDVEVHLRVDATLPYARVLQVMGVVQQAGLHRIGFVAQKDGS
jgi:biopolymer transport protein TolR